MTQSPEIKIIGANEHNLKNLSFSIPRDKLIVFTGLSGSGKSSLAFDTIYAEGQRRYVESLSAYARQFLGQLDKPNVDHIEGLSPAISIDQKSGSKNPRSTVGTTTEIYDYLRVLYARLGTQYCPKCNSEVTKNTLEQIVETSLERFDGKRIYVVAPVIRGRKGNYAALITDLVKKGFIRAYIDSKLVELEDLIERDVSSFSEFQLGRYQAHDISVVVDRIIVKPSARLRLSQSIEKALLLAEKNLEIKVVNDKGEIIGEEKFFQDLICATCGISFQNLEPRTFSFNSPFGACKSCAGLGTRYEVDPDLVVANPNLSIKEGAIVAWANTRSNFYRAMLDGACEAFNIDQDLPFEKLTKSQQRLILYGNNKERVRFKYTNRFGRRREFETEFPGAIRWIEKHYQESETESLREYYRSFMREVPCSDCGGSRLNEQARFVRINGTSISSFCEVPISESLKMIKGWRFTGNQLKVASRVIKEVSARLQFLIDVGLDYLSLSRASKTLSGGEAQRIRLASQIGSGLVGVLYVLDEPSIGLHQRDNKKLIGTLVKLRDLGNTVIVVEHDEETIRAADHIVDIGPKAGEKGGYIVAQGSLADIIASKESVTGKYLSGERRIPVPAKRRYPKAVLKILGANLHNLKNIDVEIPLGVFACVTGVSGSGKSSLVLDVLFPALQKKLLKKPGPKIGYRDISGTEMIERVIEVDQSPIGRTPRSNPATYTKAFDAIRSIFASRQESLVRGYKPGRFSFNVEGGRCEVCSGDGVIKIEMHFLPDVYITCDACGGKRYNRETLEILFKGKTISDVLDMSVSEAIEHFQGFEAVTRILKMLEDVGLGYIKLGQSATTLSGGEAQRVKLASELYKRSRSNGLYILDEPTTGLHFDDVKKLLEVLNRLVEQGNSVVVIEHNLDVIKSADYVIDLGPGGGENGGDIVCQGTPEEVADCKDSFTGKFLKKALKS